MNIPTIKQIEKGINLPAKKWEGRCYEIASLILKSKLVKGKLRYGHYKGEVAKNSIFFGRSSAGFCRHGWIELSNGMVIDPTRWCFEGKKPYLFIQRKSKEYDVGGNEFRTSMAGGCPSFSETGRHFPIPKNINKIISTVLPQKQEEVSMNQMFWLANYDPGSWNNIKQAKQVYDWICTQNYHCQALIPIDNYKLVTEG